MKFRIPTLAFAMLFAFLLVIVPTFVFAQDKLSLNIGNRENVQNRIEEKKASVEAKVAEKELKVAEVKEKIASRRAGVQARQVQHIKDIFGKILTRYETALNRFEKFFIRIDSRIAKLKAKGVDTSKAETALAAARVQYEVAKAAVADAKAKIAAIDPATSKREALKEAVTALKTAKKEIQRLHKALANTVVELKVAHSLRTATGSSSPSASASAQ